MPLHPDDVVRKTFRNSQFRRGYDEREVDSFLEEVEAELRRLYARVDELETEALHRDTLQDPGQDSERVRLERQQLDVVRAERAALVQELQGLQAQIDTGLKGAPPGVAVAQEPDSQRDQLRREVAELEAEVDRVRQGHHEFCERMIESLHEHLQLLEDGSQASSRLVAPVPPVR